MILQTMPIHFLDTVTPTQFDVVVFCATLLGTLTLVTATLYLLFRPIKESGILAPLAKLGDRFGSILVVMLSVVTSWFGAFFLKQIFSIPRPFVFNPAVHPLFMQSGLGFPSEHAAVFMSLAVAIWYLNRRAGAIFLILALIIGTARVFAGVHTPLDILGGFLLGALVSMVFKAISRK